MRTKWAIMILLLVVTSYYGQTALEFETKYGPPVHAFAVSESISMTPSFDSEGQVCQIRLYPKRIASDATYLSRQLVAAELEVVLRQLVPVSNRGKIQEPFGMTATGGGAIWTTYTYERVSIIYTSSFRVTPDSLKESRPYTLSTLNSSIERSEQPAVSVGRPSPAPAAEVVVIKWTERKCTWK